MLKLRHEYATHADGWVARKKRSNAVKEPMLRWGVTDSGATCSRVGPNYQVVVPEWSGPSEYRPTEISTETFRAPSLEKLDLLQEYLASIEPLYKDYVLQRRTDRKSYRDMGTFREWACEQLHAADFDVQAAKEAVEKAMQLPAAFEAEKSYEVWDSNQARQFKSALDKHSKDMWKSWKKAADNKPHKALVAFYYRSKHSDGACRRGPVMLEETNTSSLQVLGTPKENLEVPPDVPQANRWLQIKCECRRWIRINDNFRYVYNACPDCEKVLCLCPACATPVVFPHDPASEIAAVAPPPAFACPNCSHVL